MKVSIIAAMDEKRGIGKDNKIPWHIREDLIHLKNLTKGKVVILGRKTYDSMVWYYDKSGRPMPGKLYIVVTHDNSYKSARDNATVAHSLDEAFKKAKNESEVFINGGANIFEQAISKADKLYLTVVRGDFNADTFFPDYSSFKKIISEEGHRSGDNKFKYLVLER